jgi:hypothetical protein
MIPLRNSKQKVVSAPHTSLDVKRINTNEIPDRIYYVYIQYNQFKDRLFHKRFETLENACRYITQTKPIIDGNLVLKEYFSLPALSHSTDPYKPKTPKKKTKKTKQQRGLA